MLDQAQKLITGLAPFLAPYPSWVKAVFALWIIASAILFLSLVLARGGQPPAGETAADSGGESRPDPPPDTDPPGTDRGTWLIVSGVELFDTRLRGGVVKVTADVNGTPFVYPSLAGIEWVEAGPGMSPQSFRLPGTSEMYRIRFTMIARVGEEEHELVSQHTETVPVADVPSTGTYALHLVNAPATRSAGVAAEIRFGLTDDP